MSDDVDIFLSYARNDYERKEPPSARLLFQALERLGWKVFWDRRLKSGENIYKAIPEKIEQSGCVVVAWSNESVDSDWVLAEADKARELETLLPVFLDRVTPPMPFGAYHANDLSDWIGDDGHGQFALLVEAVTEKVGPPPSPRGEDAEPAVVAPEPARGEYLVPGVYIEEIPSGLRALEPASTSTAVFLGHTPHGLTDAPTFVTSLSAYEESFELGEGDGESDSTPNGGDMRRSIRAFFENGGTRAYIVRARSSVDELEAYADALATLDDIRNVNVLLLPGVSWTSGATSQDADSANDPRDLIRLALAHCEHGRDRMLLIDPPVGVELRSEADVNALGLPRSAFAALYFPWLESTVGGASELVPPSALAAGIWARTDVERGVWKAPAGLGAGIRGGYRPQYSVQGDEQAAINPLGLNAIRSFDSNPPVLFGARTLAPPDEVEWRYLNVRRMAIFIEKSIDEATQWTVFEPNDSGLWDSLTRAIDNFMNGLWRMGAFAGATPTEAWFVNCGLGASMTPNDIDTGRLIFDVGFAAIRPAEFVVVRFVRHSA